LVWSRHWLAKFCMRKVGLGALLPLSQCLIVKNSLLTNP